MAANHLERLTLLPPIFTALPLALTLPLAIGRKGAEYEGEFEYDSGTKTI